MHRSMMSSTALDNIIEWVEHGIGETLDDDPSGFLLGTEAPAVVEVLRNFKSERNALRELLRLAEPACTNRQLKGSIRAALERTK